jgi:integrase
MSGSIGQRGAASWEIRVYAGIDPDSRKARYRTATVHGNRADAERGLERLVAEVSSVKTIGSSSTVSELLESWFAIASLSWAPTTIRQTRSVLDRYLHPHLGAHRVGDVTPALIDATYAGLRAGGGMHGKPLGAGSLARVHVVLRSAFSQAKRWGWVRDNPAQRAHRIVVPPREMRPPTPTEVQQLLRHIANVDVTLHVFVLLAAITGARRSQLLALRWDDVNHSTMRVSFRSGWVEGPQGPTLAATKSKRSHSVDLDPHTYQSLIALESNRQARGFVFSDDGGVTAWKPNRVTKSFVRYRRILGLRDFRLHDLRHFMATELLDAGIPLPVVSRRLDHQRASTTLNVYAHAVPGRDAPAAELLHRIIHHQGTSTI